MQLSDVWEIDFLGQAFELEACAKVAESQTAERAMLKAAYTLRQIERLKDQPINGEQPCKPIS